MTISSRSAGCGPLRGRFLVHDEVAEPEILDHSRRAQAALTISKIDLHHFVASFFEKPTFSY